jgi:outer membrane receptor protein involved in Fe transport
VIYDNGNSRITGFNGELDFKASDDFDLFGRVEFRNYVLATEAQPWNLPKFKLTAGTVIHITDKLNINATLLYRGNTFDRSVAVATGPTGPITTVTFIPIKGFADLNGGVEYKINGTFSIFGQVNNILNTTNQVWLYYPNYGFNIFGGVGVHF